MANFEAFTEEVQQYSGFVSLLEEGSVAAGDPWQEGFSDHDLHLITQEDYPSDVRFVQEALRKYPLGDKYLVTHHRQADFVQEGHTLNDLSVQFRSAVIVGEDLVAQRPPYSKTRAMSHGYVGLRGIEARLEKRILNGDSWSEDRLRHESYDLLKKWFCYNAAIVYGRGEDYPVQRADVIPHLPDAEMGAEILRVTNSIATAERYELTGVMDAAKALTMRVLYPPRIDEDDPES